MPVYLSHLSFMQYASTLNLIRSLIGKILHIHYGTLQ